MKGIADAGFVVVAGDRDDWHHGWALDIARSLKETHVGPYKNSLNLCGLCVLWGCKSWSALALSVANA